MTHETMWRKFTTNASRNLYSQSLRTMQSSQRSPTCHIIAGLLENGGEDEVAFAMQHLYRKSSILPEFLKGTDAQLYRALVKSFEVTLRPVVLQSYSDFDGFHRLCKGITWDQQQTDSSSESEPPDNEISSKTNSEVTFHLPMVSAIEQISYKNYIEHTGNEPQAREYQYFGGGMFVRKKGDKNKAETAISRCEKGTRVRLSEEKYTVSMLTIRRSVLVRSRH